MKALVMAVSMLALGTASFAGPQPINPSKQTQNIQSLGKAWKSYHSLQGNRTHNDIEMVYGGADINPSTVVSNPIAV